MATKVVVARTVAVALGAATFITILYTSVTDGSPFRMELLTPWMKATLIDFYVNIILLAAWVWYKESTWGLRIIWTLLLIGFGSVTTSWYVAIQLFKISVDDPLYFALLRDQHARKGG
ncbi:hypothetical protein O6H91_18G054000 [Diphasiastrum complanatum]|uniref:Uncharacterized protein n=1 Tax=Diphasiastrum complanatum TaxID=34168 RepID=A0ACC2B1F8_DIPCM|nr:hypothetical protein O6H91_18G054000 [Diphasiastrum complanatum]